MPGSVIETKLLPPRIRAGAVSRPRLAEMLLRGTNASLTLVSAPAGFGKTTLLGTLPGTADGGGRATAWVSLDDRDHDHASFWTYVLLGIDRVVPGVAAGALTLLESGSAPIEDVLAAVLNELSVFPDDVNLVLDDYHLADGPYIQPGMSFLLDHLPPQLHIVIGTRADPALPLARLRARGELVEIRAKDLRFTEDEVVTYLDSVPELDLAAAEIAALENRTEGWIAALQLASLSLQGRKDPAEFIAEFAGDDRYVVDYLIQEVLDRQPDDVRDFLLETSVLEQLTGALCDAVTGQPGGSMMLETLERLNLFLVPLDNNRRWYRYHHLFGDVLRAHLLQERPSDIAELHERASRWYAEAGDPSPAIRHALAAGDLDRAADLVELALPDQRRDRHEDVVRGWMNDLPADVVNNRPVLAIGFVGGMMASNEFDGVGQRLDAIEEMLARPADELLVIDHDELPRLPGAIETFRAALALIAGDPAGTAEHAELAVSRAAANDHLTKSAASALAGLAMWGSGDLNAAHERYVAAAEGLERAGHVADVLGCSIALADIQLTLGRLNDAERTFLYALDLAHETPRLRGTADMHVGLSHVAWERNDLAAAAEHLRRADALGDEAGLPQNPYRWRVAMARIREAEGDPRAAVSLIDDAIRVYVADFSPEVRPLHAVRARLLISAGDVAGARMWARDHDLSFDSELSYAREYEHLTLARVLLADHAATGADGALSDAIGLLERLLEAAELGGRTGTIIEILVLQALALPIDSGAQALDQALALAEPEGHVRVFTAEGRPMVELLRRANRRSHERAYVLQLLEAATTSASHAGAEPRPARQDLVDPLSERELDVLRLLASDLDGPEIARHLVVSLNTVRTHTKHIYTKLDVNNRRAAVRQGHHLHLLG